MALALGRTANQPLGWADLGLGGASLCWGTGFYYGCRHIEATQMLRRLNMKLHTEGRVVGCRRQTRKPCGVRGSDCLIKLIKQGARPHNSTARLRAVTARLAASGS
jgi:hypothetical protein